MQILYRVGIYIYQASIRIAALLGNSKAKLWIAGRKNWHENLESALKGKSSRRIWIHCASLGEFEQGRPLLDSIKKNSPEICLVLTFFSPSGYEVRRNYANADVICYLPLDSPGNAQKFIDTISPSQVIFIKYEYWLYYFEELGKRKIPLYLASAIFRPGQIFFRSYSSLFRNALKNVRHFFVQDENSKLLLEKINLTNVTVTGDTRFDRVSAVVSERKKVDLLESFRNNRRLIIAGSSWREDEETLLEALGRIEMRDIAIVIAPHEVNESRVNEIIKTINRLHPNAAISKYSSGICKGTETFFILDTIGLLSAAYSYGKIAWIGGGFGKGIHNILEAAAFGNPVLFGPNFEKFREANDLIRLKGAFTVDSGSAAEIISRLLNDVDFYSNCSKASSDYVASNTGATNKILQLTGLLTQKV